MSAIFVLLILPGLVPLLVLESWSQALSLSIFLEVLEFGLFNFPLKTFQFLLSSVHKRWSFDSYSRVNQLTEFSPLGNLIPGFLIISSSEVEFFSLGSFILHFRFNVMSWKFSLTARNFKFWVSGFMSFSCTFCITHRYFRSWCFPSWFQTFLLWRTTFL